MNNIFAIGIPTINRWDLLKPSLEKYLVNYTDTMIFIVDNGNQAIDVVHPNVKIIKNNPAESVAESWNQLCVCIFKMGIQNAFILNDDVYISLTKNHITILLTLYKNHDFYVSQKGYCSFILPCSTWNKIGCFDNNFKGAYFEDNDYNRRLWLAKANVMINVALNPDVFRESSSIEKDPSLNNNFDRNVSYYIDKWGGTVGNEKFLTPFNK